MPAQPNNEHDGAGERLAEAGIDATPERLAVLAALADGHHRHVEHVVEALPKQPAQPAAVGPTAVAQALADLTAADVVRRIDPPEGDPLYEVPAEDHHHMVCTSCGLVTDAPVSSGEPSLRSFTCDRCKDPTCPWR